MEERIFCKAGQSYPDPLILEGVPPSPLVSQLTAQLPALF